ncbi:hypothetical protein AUC47_06925 [Microbacterium sp. SZ1]|uniref:hypothetical protein n=1 Tax=Microbacterium sp. SZ1 TaxID=1849736 RepID=UPI000BBBF18B|nr:hypothetical protein [Microbacterium sp. SZ1]PCE13543.1 hypothetical protein AUC47_06925 [Microbacterium sp. SZ1]
MDELLPDVHAEEISKYCSLVERVNADAVRPTAGDLRFEYTAAHLAVILDLAYELGLRAWDAVSFTAQQVFPHLTILDSTTTPISTLDALPKHGGGDQRSSTATRTSC